MLFVCSNRVKPISNGLQFELWVAHAYGLCIDISIVRYAKCWKHPLGLLPMYPFLHRILSRCGERSDSRDSHFTKFRSIPLRKIVALLHTGYPKMTITISRSASTEDFHFFTTNPLVFIFRCGCVRVEVRESTYPGKKRPGIPLYTWFSYESRFGHST